MALLAVGEIFYKKIPRKQMEWSRGKVGKNTSKVVRYRCSVFAFKSNAVSVLCNKSTKLLFRYSVPVLLSFFKSRSQDFFPIRANINLQEQKADHSTSHRSLRRYNRIMQLLFFVIDFSRSSRDPCFANPALHKTGFSSPAVATRISISTSSD